MVNCVRNRNIVAAMVGDAVIKQLRRLSVEFPPIFLGDLVGGLLQRFLRLGIEIRAGKFDSLADMSSRDLPSELVRILIIIFGNLPVAFLMFHHVL